MREIKFRAWDIEHNTGMFYPVEWFFGDGDVQVIKAKHPAGKHIKVIPMVYTGLKDKNNRDVYEGDILNFSGVEEHRVKVVYDIIGFAFVDVTTGAYMEWPMMDGRIMPSAFDGSRFEVVGNIYQNKELLK